MKKNKIKFVIVLLLIIISQFASGKNSKSGHEYLENLLLGDNPTYQLILKNDTLSSNLRYEFDIYIVRTGTVPLELVSVSPIMTFNPAISSGSLSFTINSGSSELGIKQQPLNKNISVVGNELRVGSEPVTYPPDVTFIDSVSGTRVGRFCINSSTPFEDHPANITWKNSGTRPIVDVTAYVSELSTDITDSTGHLNVLTNSTLSPLAITSNSPLPNVSAGVAYADTLRASGGTLPYTWTIIADSLPSGLSLSVSGVITGTATIIGTSTFTVQVTDSLSTSVTKIFSITVVPGSAVRLNIQTQPSPTTTAGIPFSTQPVIRIEDTFGNLVVSDNSTTVTASRNTGNGILQGVTSVVAVGGIASFTNLSYTRAETFTLRFTSRSLTAATSNSIAVNAGPPTKVIVEKNPSDSGTVVPSQNLASGNSITVYAVSRDSFNNFVANVVATWSLIDITGGIVAGDLVPNVGDTSATLTGSIIGTAKIKATYGTLDSIQSGTITVTHGVGTQLAFTQQPTAGIAGAVIIPPIKVQIKDLVGNNVRNPGDTINISLQSGSGIISGTIQQLSDTAGTATFNNLSINQPGIKTLRAYHTIYSSALSDTFTLGTYTITATAGSNGSISPSGVVDVNNGSNQTFTITPNTGYHVDSVIVDGVKVDSITSYTFNNVIANHTIRASFAINAYTITATAGSNGNISPLGVVNINYGGNQAFTISPNIGYHIDSVIVDGVKVDSTTSYTFNNVITNHTIRVVFAIDVLTITATAGSNGSISPSGVVGVNYGDNQIFTITPNTGYHVDSVIVDGVKVDSTTSYTFNNIAANHNIYATFVADVPVVNVKIFLQAPFSSGTMNSALRNVLPLSQSYNALPWNYNGTEHVSVIPDSVVDWVLVELRTGTSPLTKVAARAAFIKRNGLIVDTSGLAPLKFSSISIGNYYVIVRHRNHIPVMSASTVSLTATSTLYDFTTGTTKYFGNDAKLLSVGTYGMYAGDYSGDEFVDSDDFIGPDNEMFQSGYRRADLDMNGFIDSDDFIHPDNNVFKGTNVPK